MNIERELLTSAKEIIEKQSLLVFQEYAQDMISQEFPCHVDWVTLFQKVYLHACLKKKRDIAEWLQTTLFPRLDPIQQIGLRQVFPYGRYLLAK